MAQCNATHVLASIRSLLRVSQHTANVVADRETRKLRSDLTALTKLELLALVDILHVGDGLTWNKL